jgi:hypothetical protein
MVNVCTSFRASALYSSWPSRFGNRDGWRRKVSRAWALKERFRTFWGYRIPARPRFFFTRWYWRATHSRLKPMAAVAKLIQRHLPNSLTDLRYRLTNAGLEGVNAVIQWIKKTARGYRYAEHFKTAIYLLCGGLDLHPPEPDFLSCRAVFRHGANLA